MNSKNEKHFSWRLNIQVCELLQALTCNKPCPLPTLKGSLKNKCSWDSKIQ